MAEPRPYASLSSGLLARKGAAKPAMRPQAFGPIGGNLEDLGWNDYGYAVPAEPLPEHVPSSIAALTPEPKAAEEPVVVEQQRAIAESFGAEAPEPEPAPVVPAEVVKLKRPAVKASPKGRKAAFTLRLDPERHYKLRLACAITGSSAQQLVTGALDRWLETLPEIDALAEHVPVPGAKRS